MWDPRANRYASPPCLPGMSGPPPRTLPPEIINMICNDLDRKTLAAFMLAHRSWYLSLRNRLWSTLVLTQDVDILHCVRRSPAHFAKGTTEEKALHFYARHLVRKDYRDIITYMAGSCEWDNCLHCHREDGINPSLVTHERAAQWQRDAVQEIVLDLVQGTPGCLQDARVTGPTPNFGMAGVLLDKLPNLKKLTIRGSDALTMIKVMSSGSIPHLCVVWEHRLLPLLESVPCDRRMAEQLTASSAKFYSLDSMSSPQMNQLRRLSFDGLRLMNLSKLIRAFTALRCVSEISLLIDPKNVPGRAQPPGPLNWDDELDLRRHKLHDEKIDPTSGEYALHFLVARLNGWRTTTRLGCHSQHSGQRYWLRVKRLGFPPTLRRLRLSDESKQGRQLCLKQIATALAPCKDFERLEMIGHSADAAEIVTGHLHAEMDGEDN